MFCHNCGSELAEGSSFCGNCGTKVAAKPAQNPAPEAQASAPASPGMSPAAQAASVAAAGGAAAVAAAAVQAAAPNPAPGAPQGGPNPAPGAPQGGPNPAPRAPQGAPNPAPNPGPQYQQNAGAMPPVRKVGFGEAIKDFFVRYVDFNGRSTRSMFWYYVLFSVVVSSILSGIANAGDGNRFGEILSIIWSLGTLVPGLALAVRRLHDIGRKWTWILMGLIPLAGPIILIVYYIKDSDGDNQFGPRIV